MEVRDVQTILKQEGFYQQTIDNLMGPATIEAIEKFQRAANLKVDGQIGPVTLGAMQA